jgi:hypothetical protein
MQSWFRQMHRKKSYSCSLSAGVSQRRPPMLVKSYSSVRYRASLPLGKQIALNTNSFFVNVPVLSQKRYSI